MEFFTLNEGSLGLKLFRIVVIIVALVLIQMIIRRYIHYIVRRAVSGRHYKHAREEKQREDTLATMFLTTATVILWVVGGVVILQELSINLAALATGAGLIGVVVGFGAQSMIKDFVTGTLIILENQYRIGDVVTIGTQSGVVEDLTLRITKLRDLDGSVYFIPNGEIKAVQNQTLEFSSVVVDVTVSYDTDVDEAEKILNEVGAGLAQDEEWQDRTIEPISFLRVNSLDESGVKLRMLGKVQPSEQWAVAGEYRKRLKKAFEKHGIEIALPQRVVRQYKSPK